MRELPPGWAEICLASLHVRSRTIEPRRTPDQEFTLYSVPSFELRQPETVLGSAIGSAKLLVEPRTVLLCKINPRINRVWVVKGSNGGVAIASSEWMTLSTGNAVLPEYLAYFLQQECVRELLAHNVSGVGGSLMRVKPSILARLSVPVAPMREQRRIVDEIDKQLSRLDSAVAFLRESDAKRRAGSRSLLQKTCSLFPRDSKRLAIADCADCLDSRRVPVSARERSKRPGNIPYFGANGQVGSIDEPIFNEPLILVVEDETFVGRTKPFAYKIEGPSWVNNHAHVLRPKPGVSLRYLHYALMFYPFTALTTGSTGRRKLTQKALMTAPFVMPDPSEQERRADFLDRFLSISEKLETATAVSMQRAARLRQSILQRAFQGKLLPQDPTDDPATTMLEEIRISGPRQRRAFRDHRLEVQA